MADWTEIVGAVGGAIGAAGGIVGAVGGVLGWRVHRRSNQIAERQDRRDAEARHDELAPHLPEWLELDLVGLALRATICVNRNYRVAGWVVHGNSHRRLELSPLLRAEMPEQFEVAKVSPGRDPGDPPPVDYVLLKFWPPLPEDEDSQWSCDCGRSTDPEQQGPGHWNRKIRVEPPRIPLAAWA